MPFAENDGVSLYYETHGDSGPGLVFAHGAGGNATSWFQQVPAFVDEYRIVVFDHRGFARSACSAEQQSGIHFDGDVIAVMDAAGLDTATLVCQSMGGWTGVRAAVNHSSRINGVFLANTPGAIHTPAVTANWTQLQQRVAEGGGLVNRAISPEFAQRSPAGALLYQQIAAYNTQAQPNIRDDDMAFAPDQVTSAGVPFHVLASDLDPLFPVELLAGIAADIGAGYTRVGGAGHSTYFEKPEAFNAVLGEFLRQLHA